MEADYIEKKILNTIVHIKLGKVVNKKKSTFSTHNWYHR